MKLLLNMKECRIHVMYPARFDKCPNCHSDAKTTTAKIKSSKDKGIKLGELYSLTQIAEMKKVMDVEV